MLTPDRPRVWTCAVFDPARDVPVADVTVTADPNLPVGSVRCLRSSADGGVRVFAEGLVVEVTPRRELAPDGDDTPQTRSLVTSILEMP